MIKPVNFDLVMQVITNSPLESNVALAFAELCHKMNEIVEVINGLEDKDD